MAALPYEERIRWFHQARFGLFIHWGLYALLERGEWVMFRERIPAEEYKKLAGSFTGAAVDADVTVYGSVCTSRTRTGPSRDIGSRTSTLSLAKTW